MSSLKPSLSAPAPLYHIALLISFTALIRSQIYLVYLFVYLFIICVPHLQLISIKARISSIFSLLWADSRCSTHACWGSEGVREWGSLTSRGDACCGKGTENGERQVRSGLERIQGNWVRRAAQEITRESLEGKSPPRSRRSPVTELTLRHFWAWLPITSHYTTISKRLRHKLLPVHPRNDLKLGPGVHLLKVTLGTLASYFTFRKARVLF